MKNHLPIANNPLETREQLADAFCELVNPLLPYYSENKALLKLWNTGCHYSEKGNECEGFLRILWGLAPYVAGGFNTPLTKQYVDALAHGVNPNDPEYFGDASDYNQRLVEMASLSFALMLSKETFWDPLSDKTKKDLYNWLNQIFIYKVGNTNWNFFRILVGLAFEHLGLPFDEDYFNKTLVWIDELYRGDGWYEDGANNSFDYYNAFAFQFYSAVYYKWHKDKDPERCEIYRKRLVKHALQMKEWVSKDGSMVPYGRSLLYKFAQCSAFAGLVYAGIDAVPIGESKHIILGNLRWWFKQPIFDRDGVLSVGYRYPNLVMSEDYNSPGGCYWGLKCFVLLALPDDHPFWKAKETDVVHSRKISVEPVPGFLVQRNDEDENVILLSGTKCRNTKSGYYFANFPDKYNKFAYSSSFGFSVQRGHTSEQDGAFDSVLAISHKGEENYTFRTEQKLLSIDEEHIHLSWEMFCGDIKAETFIIPCDGWHIRIHKIVNRVPISTIEGGFSIYREQEANLYNYPEPSSMVVFTADGATTALADMFGNRLVSVCGTVANSNVLFQRAFLPSAKCDLPCGTNYLACAVFAGKHKEYVEKQLNHKIIVVRDKESFSVKIDGHEIYTNNF